MSTSLELNNQLWENTYTIIYETKSLNEHEVGEVSSNLLPHDEVDNNGNIDNIPLVGQVYFLLFVLGNVLFCGIFPPSNFKIISEFR